MCCSAAKRRSRRRVAWRSTPVQTPPHAGPLCNRSLDARVPDLRQIAQQVIRVRSVNGVAAAALGTFNDPAIAPMLIDAYPLFDAADRPRLMAALTSRPAYAAPLLEAVAAGRIPRAAVAASDAQQIRSLNDAAITRRLGEVWGEVRDTPEAKRQLATRYKAELTPALLASADLSQGRAVYAGSCGACHVLYGEGGKLGPDLTGGERRHDLDSLLAKIVDPSAELPVASRYTIVKLKDGRTVGGIVDNRTSMHADAANRRRPDHRRRRRHPIDGAVERVADAGGTLRELHAGTAAESRRLPHGRSRRCRCPCASGSDRGQTGVRPGSDPEPQGSDPRLTPV